MPDINSSHSLGVLSYEIYAVLLFVKVLLFHLLLCRFLNVLTIILCDTVVNFDFLKQTSKAKMKKASFLFLSLAIASFAFASENDVPDVKDSGN